MSAKTEKAGWLRGVLDSAGHTTHPGDRQPSLDELAKGVTDAHNALVHCQAEKERWSMREAEATADLKETEKLLFDALEKRGIHARPR